MPDARFNPAGVCGRPIRHPSALAGHPPATMPVAASHC